MNFPYRYFFYFTLILSLITNQNSLFAQDVVRVYKLEEIISIAKSQSPDAVAAKHKFRASYWEYRAFKDSNMPLLSMDGTIPNFNRSISRITNYDGTESFIEQNIVNSDIGMSLTKNLAFSGGEIFLNSDLKRIDLLSDSITTTSYMTNPLTIGLRQPVFSYNAFKWNKRIAPKKYDEAKKKYIETIEQISVKATNLFFDLLLAQININISVLNKANNDTIYKIAQGRFNYGKIAENELLQTELRYLNSKAAVEKAKINLEINLFKLRSFLGVKDDEKFELSPPRKTYDITISLDKAHTEARKNRSATTTFQRKIIEAESEISRAKLNNRFSADLYALYGLTKSANDFSNAYKNPQEQQQLIFGIQIPLLDWGLARGKIKMAESNHELVVANVEQQKIDFDQEVFLKVMQFNMQKNQLLIAAKSDTVAQKRYYVTKQRYMIGKIDITELNIALTEKDEARQSYIAALRKYWQNFYEVRKLTLYNFIYDYPLVFEMDDVM